MLTRMVNHVHFIFAVRIPQHRRNCASASTQLVAVLRLLLAGRTDHQLKCIKLYKKYSSIIPVLWRAAT
uniref:Uncharacterized protein n=1 Tax=Zea mays TaxID=4577 RepID=C0PEW3_MAIZE|nr:unknown [Zea mays]